MSDGARSEAAAELATALERLDEITRRLRVECPWDREQDERSIVPHTVEEAYELADAIQRADDDRIRDELGDVLFQVVFLSLLLEERGVGSLTAVIEEITAKLVRRHPHVFAESEARELLDGADTRSAGGVLANWDRIKLEVEGRGAGDRFADIPENLPGLLYARKILRRRDPDGGSAADRATRDSDQTRVGEMLLEAVGLARDLGVDPELAVRVAAERLRDSAPASD